MSLKQGALKNWGIIKALEAKAVFFKKFLLFMMVVIFFV
jgi:hypothetical protein